jgi:phytoene desaturase
MKAIVIGAGIGGLAAAVRLRLKGYEVSVFEANPYPGGKLHRKTVGSYRFDGGPSLFTMPHFVDELFSLAGKNPRDYFNYQKSSEACRYFWEDGKQFYAPADPKAFAQEAEKVFGYPKNDLMAYFKHVETIYQNSGKIFLEKSLRKTSTWLNQETLKAFLQIRKYDLLKTMNDANRIRIGEPHLVQLFNRFATYNGSNPYEAPGILNVIPWLEHGFGTFFPIGGMEEIANSVYRLALDLGVSFEFNTRVQEVLHDRKRVKGIMVSNRLIQASIVVSNMDIHFVYKDLLKDIPQPKRILSQERSSSALVFYWGMNGSFETLGLHNIFFSDRYKEEFQALFKEGSMIDDPTVYIHISSKMNPQDAPSGGENWFVMVNAPHHQGQNWDAILSQARKNIITKLSRVLNVEIEKFIENEISWTPKGIETDTLSYKGALYGNSSNNKFSAFLRHPNHSSSLKGLYFCGGSVHPGGGIPLSLLSAKIMSEEISSN